MSEIELLKQFQSYFPKQDATVLSWAGEDGALIDLSNQRQVAVNDLLIESVHFDLSYFPLNDLGYKSVAVNISDIISCGATPAYMMIGLAVPSNFNKNKLSELYVGIKEACEQFGLSFAGGDFSSADKMFISVSIIGYLNKNEKFISRKNGKVGDNLYLTGNPGFSALGLDFLQNPEFAAKYNETNLYKDAIRQHLRPTLPIGLNNYLKKNNLEMTASTDVSDGLSVELNDLAEESGLQIELFSEVIPLPDIENGFDYALNGGEDYGLLFTSPNEIEVTSFENYNNIRLTKIGILKSGSSRVVTTNGKIITRKGYDHLTSS